MLKFIAARKLCNSLRNLEAPMPLINKRSFYFQDIIDDIAMRNLSPDEGAKFILSSVYHAFDRHPSINAQRSR